MSPTCKTKTCRCSCYREWHDRCLHLTLWHLHRVDSSVTGNSKAKGVIYISKNTTFVTTRRIQTT